MENREYKFYLHKSVFLYWKLMVGFLCFAVYFVFATIGVNPLSIVLALLILILGSSFLIPFLYAKRPAYIISNEGIRQYKTIFLGRKISWEEIQSITYPVSFLMGGKDTVLLRTVSRSFLIGLSGVDQPLDLLKTLNHFKPFGLGEDEARVYFEKYFDREKIFYIMILYLLISIAILMMATFDMPYVWLEDNRYNAFWGALFFAHLFFSIATIFFVYKNFKKIKNLIKSVIFIWFVVLIGPFLVENNAYYNVRAIKALEKEEYAVAEEYIRKAIEIHPEGYSYYETLGKALYGLGRYEESANIFKFLLGNDERLTDYYIAYYHVWVGKSLWNLNKADEARQEFNIVKKYKISEFNKEIKEFGM